MLTEKFSVTIEAYITEPPCIGIQRRKVGDRTNLGIVEKTKKSKRDRTESILK